MLSFFDSITSFISTIWGFFQNTFEWYIQGYTFLYSSLGSVALMFPALPSMVAVGVTCTLSIMIIRFLLFK